MSFPSQSDTPFVRKHRNKEINIHVPPTRVKGHHRRLPQQINPTHSGYRPTKFERNLSIGLSCNLGYNFFARGCAIARSMRHVQLIGIKSVLSSFNFSGVSNEYSPVKFGPAVRAPEAKMLGQTYRRTDKQRPDYFFPATNQRKCSSKSLQC